jgi:hypothetical protein
MKSFALRDYVIFALLIIGFPCILNAQESAYTDQEVIEVEPTLNGLKGNIDKIKILLKLSDWYEASYNNPKTLEKAFEYANEALYLSRSLHSAIYTGKCYLQLSMLSELRNNNMMIEICARKAIAQFTNTDQTDDLAEAWVKVWSAKMRTNAPMAERFVPIFKALTLFKQSGNMQRTGDCYKEISELYFTNSDFKNSMKSLKKAIFYYKAANLKEIEIYPIYSRLIILYETDKKSKDIIKLKNKTSLQQSKLKNEVL